MAKGNNIRASDVPAITLLMLSVAMNNNDMSRWYPHLSCAGSGWWRRVFWSYRPIHWQINARNAERDQWSVQFWIRVQCKSNILQQTNILRSTFESPVWKATMIMHSHKRMAQHCHQYLRIETQRKKLHSHFSLRTAGMMQAWVGQKLAKGTFYEFFDVQFYKYLRR